MKCLQNLSLVPDEMIDRLQKDIENIINDYIDLNEACLKAYDSVVNKLDKNDIIKITNAFHPEWYFIKPKPIYTDSDFVYLIENLISECDPDSVACNILHMMGPKNNLGVFDTDKHNYWFYKDGSNWEAWLLDEDYFKEEIREHISLHFEDEDLLLILKALREIQDKHKVNVVK